MAIGTATAYAPAASALSSAEVRVAVPPADANSGRKAYIQWTSGMFSRREEDPVTSRLWVDVRGGEGTVIADMLRRIGFIVEEVVPVPDTERVFHSAQSYPSNDLSLPERLVLPAHSRFFGGTYRSIKEAHDRLPNEEAVLLFQRWLR